MSGEISLWSGIADLELLDLGFLVDHVLTNNRVIFLDLHLGRHVPLVLVGGVEMTGFR